MKIRIGVAIAMCFCLTGVQSAQQSGKTMRSTGRVATVAADSITTKLGSASLTFTVDGSTKVVGKGVGTKIAALKAANKPTQITDLVDEYDSVTVEYDDMGSGKLHARRIDIRMKGIKKK